MKNPLKIDPGSVFNWGGGVQNFILHRLVGFQLRGGGDVRPNPSKTPPPRLRVWCYINSADGDGLLVPCIRLRSVQMISFLARCDICMGLGPDKPVENK